MGYLQTLLARNESVVFATRRHWIVLVGSGLVNLLLLAVIVAATLLLSTTLGPLAPVILVLALVPIVRFAVRMIEWLNEQYVITNRRVIQTEGFVTKHVIDSSLEKVNDVVLTQSVWGRLLGYGDIEILTASEIGVNRLDRIRDPVHFKTAMLDQKESMGVRNRTDDVMSAGAPDAADIPDIIAELDTLRQQNIISDEEFEQKKSVLLGKL